MSQLIDESINALISGGPAEYLRGEGAFVAAVVLLDVATAPGEGGGACDLVRALWPAPPTVAEHEVRDRAESALSRARRERGVHVRLGDHRRAERRCHLRVDRAVIRRLLL